jgi:hypothetical protein
MRRTLLRIESENDMDTMECSRCNEQLVPGGKIDRLTRLGDMLLCFMCLHAYAEAALINGIHPGPAHMPERCDECGMKHAPGKNTLCSR